MKPRYRQAPDTSLNGVEKPEVTPDFEPSQITVEDLQRHADETADGLGKRPAPMPRSTDLKDSKGTSKQNRPVEPTVSPDYAAMGEALRIRPEEDIPPPPVCLLIQQEGQTSTFGTLGNFSVLIGKAKSRKTFAITMALAAALKRDLVLNRFAGVFDEGKQGVLYFDTE